MNVKSHQKTSISPQHTNQKSLPAFLKLPPPTVNLIPKEHVGKIQSNKLMPEQIDNQTGQQITPKKYSETNTHQNQSLPIPYNEDSSLFFFPSYLFEDFISEENTAGQVNITQEPVNEPTEITDRKVQDNKENVAHKPHNNIGIIPIRQHDRQKLDKDIENHPLTPIIEEWLKQRGGNKGTLNSYRYKIRVFLTFLIDLNVQYPERSHFLLYKHALIRSNTLQQPAAILSAAKTFFKWAKSKGYYKNIAK